jgi:hypothetical protein
MRTCDVLPRRHCVLFALELSHEGAPRAQVQVAEVGARASVSLTFHHPALPELGRRRARVAPRQCVFVRVAPRQRVFVRVAPRQRVFVRVAPRQRVFVRVALP